MDADTVPHLLVPVEAGVATKGKQGADFVWTIQFAHGRQGVMRR
jgi:hypothetical protein